MKKFVLKPAKFKAIQFKDDGDVIADIFAFLDCTFRLDYADDKKPKILIDKQVALPGDWIMKSPWGHILVVDDKVLHDFFESPKKDNRKLRYDCVSIAIQRGIRKDDIIDLSEAIYNFVKGDNKGG